MTDATPCHGDIGVPPTRPPGARRTNTDAACHDAIKKGLRKTLSKQEGKYDDAGQHRKHRERIKPITVIATGMLWGDAALQKTPEPSQGAFPDRVFTGHHGHNNIFFNTEFNDKFLIAHGENRFPPPLGRHAGDLTIIIRPHFGCHANVTHSGTSEKAVSQEATRAFAPGWR
jgi:hypothetical protein